MSYNNESSVAGSSRSLNRNVSSPTSNHTEDPTFWVPGASGGQCSDVHSGELSHPITFTCLSYNISISVCFQWQADDSDPQTPTSPTSSNRSFTLSVNSIPIVRSDRHVVMTSTSPARPKVASMQAKLDHTKIDTSLYQQVGEGRHEIQPAKLAFLELRYINFAFLELTAETSVNGFRRLAWDASLHDALRRNRWHPNR